MARIQQSNRKYHVHAGASIAPCLPTSHRGSLIAALAGLSFYLVLPLGISSCCSSGPSKSMPAQDTRTFSDLVSSLKSQDPNTRRDAAANLGMIRAWRATPFLVETLDDPDSRVRITAYTSLKKLTGEYFSFSVAKEKYTEWWKANKDKDHPPKALSPSEWRRICE